MAAASGRHFTAREAFEESYTSADENPFRPEDEGPRRRPDARDGSGFSGGGGVAAAAKSAWLELLIPESELSAAAAAAAATSLGRPRGLSVSL